MTKQSIDERILLLQFFGILFVVLGHTGNSISIFFDWFPYGSFHMALFIFISGYLYKEESEIQPFKFIGKKFKSLVIPLYIWQFLYALLWMILTRYDLLRYGDKPNLKNFLICPWTYGPRYGLTEASWFIATLFLIHLINIFIRKLFRISKKKVNEYGYLVILCVCGFWAIVEARKIGGLFGGMSQFQSMVTKVGFLFPFYQMGHLIKKWGGKLLDNISSTIYLSFLMGVQLILSYFSGGTSGLFNTVVQPVYPSPIIAYLISCTGIFFWFRLAKIFLPSLKNSKVISCVGRNTFSIVIHHQFGVYLINWLMYGIKLIVGGFGGLSVESIKTNYWYTYSPNRINTFKVVYLVGSIIFSLAIGYLCKFGGRKIYENIMQKGIVGFKNIKCAKKVKDAYLKSRLIYSDK